ncbi:hypothetical protein [Schlesneria paludicola]|uniref:hypothetical protein n=1 Tax=Schlesneria paludicola TaxID=360056 RepID=UPI0012F74163|nr:hypothetical protein [Schlesneria paludicola]
MKKQPRSDPGEQLLKAFIQTYIAVECPEFFRERARIDRARQRREKKRRERRMPKTVDEDHRKNCAREIAKLLIHGPIPASELRIKLREAGFLKPLVGSVMVELKVREKQIERPGPVYAILHESMIDRVRELVGEGEMVSNSTSKTALASDDSTTSTSNK